MGGRRGGAKRVGLHAAHQRTFAVDGAAEGVDDAAEPAAGRVDRVDAVLECCPGAECDTFELPKRHGQRAAVAEADDLAGGLPAVSAGKFEPAA